MCAALSHVCRRRCQPATGPAGAPGSGQERWGGSGAARHSTRGRAPRSRHGTRGRAARPAIFPSSHRSAAMLCRKAVAGLNPRNGAPLGSAAALCPVVWRRAGVPSRFFRCLRPISSGQMTSLKPSSSRARKATNRSIGLGNCRRAVPPCAEKTQQHVNTCPGEGAEGHTGTPERLSRTRTSGGLRACGDSNRVAIGLVRGFPALSGC